MQRGRGGNDKASPLEADTLYADTQRLAPGAYSIDCHGFWMICRKWSGENEVIGPKRGRPKLCVRTRDLPVPARARPLERRPVGDRIQGQRTVRSAAQGVADAKNLAVEAAVHLSLNEAVQGQIHRGSSAKQRHHDEREGEGHEPPAEGSRDQSHGGSAVSL